MKELLKTIDFCNQVDVLLLNIKMLNEHKTILNDNNNEVTDMINYLNNNNIKYELNISDSYFRITLV